MITSDDVLRDGTYPPRVADALQGVYTSARAAVAVDGIGAADEFAANDLNNLSIACRPDVGDVDGLWATFVFSNRVLAAQSFDAFGPTRLVFHGPRRRPLTRRRQRRRFDSAIDALRAAVECASSEIAAAV